MNLFLVIRWFEMGVEGTGSINYDPESGAAKELLEAAEKKNLPQPERKGQESKEPKKGGPEGQS